MKLVCLTTMLLAASISWAKGVEPKKLDRKDWSQWPSCSDTSWNNMVANYKLTCPNLGLDTKWWGRILLSADFEVSAFFIGWPTSLVSQKSPFHYK